MNIKIYTILTGFELLDLPKPKEGISILYLNVFFGKTWLLLSLFFGCGDIWLKIFYSLSNCDSFNFNSVSFFNNSSSFFLI